MRQRWVQELPPAVEAVVQRSEQPDSFLKPLMIYC
jgi:hypothetical protein